MFSEHSKSATPSSIETSSESNNKGRVEGFSTSNPGTVLHCQLTKTL